MVRLIISTGPYGHQINISRSQKFQNITSNVSEPFATYNISVRYRRRLIHQSADSSGVPSQYMVCCLYRGVPVRSIFSKTGSVLQRVTPFSYNLSLSRRLEVDNLSLSRSVEMVFVRQSLRSCQLLVCVNLSYIP